jgi:hypothetical protein
MDNFKKCVTLLTALNEDEIGKALQLLELFTHQTVTKKARKSAKSTYRWSDGSDKF